ncbi:MAG: PQQ-dependent sugar dehydrogenase [Gemmatimonadaceae bacterium]
MLTNRTHRAAAWPFRAAILVALASGCGTDSSAPASDTSSNRTACSARDASLTLPSGFCATIFADGIGAARHVVVAPNGDVFVTIQGGGPVVALRDADRDGRADSVVRIGSGSGGTGIGLYGGFLYVDQGSQIVRYPLPSGSLRPSGASQSVVTGLPTGGHDARNFAIDQAGNLFVNVGSSTNSCQESDRTAGSPGIDPCPELTTRAGIWRFSATATGQAFAASARYATGLRNSEGLAFAADGSLWAATHGRDQLYDNWPKLFDAAYSADNPGEELVQVNQNDDFGWPYCYYALASQKLVLAPEFGGDGTQITRCDQRKNAVVAMPGHWAPMSLLFYTGSSFPAHYAGGAFIAFHGSWNRAPEPQAGYRVVFIPAANGRPSTQYETFADGFAGGTLDPDGAAHRPVGLAQGPSGEIYITDDKAGRVWKVVYAP